MAIDARVLCVDDEEAHAELTGEWLERAGFEVVVETEATAALDRLDGVDCVVSDYDMPEMDGLALLERVREHRSDLPFVLFTGKGSEEIASEAISAGVTDYLQKGGAEQYELLARRVSNAVERARTERRLERSEERYRELVETAPVPIVVHQDGEMVYANQAAAEFAGTDGPESLVGRSVFEFVPPEYQERIRERIGEVMASGGRAETIEARFRTVGGEERHALVTGARITFEGEAAVQAVLRDVTERRRRKEQLRAERSFTRSIVEAAPDAIYAIDESFRFTLVNEPLAEAMGLPREEIVGEPLDLLADRDVIDEDELERGREVIRDLAESEAEQTRFETRLTPRFDMQVVENNIALLEPDGDGFPGAVNVVRDVTEQRMREETLAALHDATHRLMAAGRTEEVCRTAVEVATDVLDLSFVGIMLVGDDELVPVATTDSAETLFDGVPSLPAGESLAWEVYERGEPHYYEDVGAVPGAYRSDTPVRSEFIAPLGDHGVLIIGEPEPGAFDEADRSFAQLLATNTEAALDRAERERELRERERELTRQNERLEEFASVVSHDLRTPLSTLSGYLDLAREEPTGEHFDGAERAVDRMETIVEDVLALARQGQAVGELEPVDLGDAVEAAWHAVDGDAAATLDAGDDLGVVHADRERLVALLENLLRNSVEHGGTGVTVSVAALDDGFAVADDGPGIPPEEREAVFERGYTTSEDGTGFGLAIVRTIAEAHGWSVAVTESERGGAHFEITGVDRD